MRHLTVPFYCVLVAAFALPLLLRAIWTGAHSFTLIFLAGFLYFGRRAVVETRKNWPAFRDEMKRRRELQRRAAQQDRHPLSDDTY